ncbi:hypothetical protein RJ55_02006 [Drechmeria coniospora]|nr:hypothetical protein RJ55_02006 [Drechmeria coniospora]
MSAQPHNCEQSAGKWAVQNMYMVDQYAARSPRKPEKHRPSKSKPSTSTSSSHMRPVSFLFVVNRLEVTYFSDQHNDQDYRRDEWLNLLPPTCHTGYTGERVSQVMRYQDGQVTIARGYQWYRPAWHEDGHFYQAAYGQLLEPYKKHAVFACNPHLPIVVIPGDPTTTNPVEGPFALHFFHSPNPELRGISFATTESGNMPHGHGPVKRVAGKHPSWIPSLVPTPYSNRLPSTSQASRGLSGEISIILGLMAFSQDIDAVEDIFVGRDGHHGLWHNRHWYCNYPPALYPLTEHHHPCGFLIAVAVDPENPSISTPERIHSFEWTGVIVKETPSSASSSSKVR